MMFFAFVKWDGEEEKSNSCKRGVEKSPFGPIYAAEAHSKSSKHFSIYPVEIIVFLEFESKLKVSNTL